MGLKYFYNWIKTFIKCSIYIYMENPGFNISAVMILGGFSILSLSALLGQMGYGHPDPVIIEIGKAAFYTGLGSAGNETQNKMKNKEY